MSNLHAHHPAQARMARPRCSSCGSTARLWPCKTAPTVQVCAVCQGWVATLRRTATQSRALTRAAR